MSGGLSAGELALTAAALSTAGAGASAYANNQNMRQQDRQTAQMIQTQSGLNQQANQRVQNTTKAIAASNPADATKQQTAAYLNALQQAAPSQNTNPSVPGGSKRFQQAQAGSTADVNDYARKTAAAIAGTAGPQLQRIGEGNKIAQTASDLGLLNDQSTNDSALLKTQLAGDQPNPWLEAASGVLSGAGTGLASYAGARGPKKTPGSPMASGEMPYDPG